DDFNDAVRLDGRRYATPGRSAAGHAGLAARCACRAVAGSAPRGRGASPRAGLAADGAGGGRARLGDGSGAARGRVAVGGYPGAGVLPAQYRLDRLWGFHSDRGLAARTAIAAW